MEKEFTADQIPSNLFDETGEYPSDDALKYIENFDCLNENPKDLIEFIERIWWAPDWGFKLSEETLELHTGGWSGNESIIASLQLNEFFFTIFWIKSERGGHYYFKLKAGVNFCK